MKKLHKLIIVLLLTLTLVSCKPSLRPIKPETPETPSEIIGNTVKFDTNGGTPIDDIKVPKGEKLDKPKVIEKLDYTFISWYTTNSYESKYDFDKEVVNEFTLYARWYEGPYIITETGFYNSKEEVALYLVIYETLPSNYRLKKEISGHISKHWTIDNMLTIGGDRFNNNEKLLPIAVGLTYQEADIDYNGETNRGAKRIVFSNSGQIYYTFDHYDSFILYNNQTLQW